MNLRWRKAKRTLLASGVENPHQAWVLTIDGGIRCAMVIPVMTAVERLQGWRWAAGYEAGIPAAAVPDAEYTEAQAKQAAYAYVDRYLHLEAA